MIVALVTRTWLFSCRRRCKTVGIGRFLELLLTIFPCFMRYTPYQGWYATWHTIALSLVIPVVVVHISHDLQCSGNPHGSLWFLHQAWHSGDTHAHTHTHTHTTKRINNIMIKCNILNMRLCIFKLFYVSMWYRKCACAAQLWQLAEPREILCFLELLTTEYLFPPSFMRSTPYQQ